MNQTKYKLRLFCFPPPFPTFTLSLVDPFSKMCYNEGQVSYLAHTLLYLCRLAKYPSYRRWTFFYNSQYVCLFAIFLQMLEPSGLKTN